MLLLIGVAICLRERFGSLVVIPPVMFTLLQGSGIQRCACLLSQWAQDISGPPWMPPLHPTDYLHPPSIHMISRAAWDVRSPLHPDGVPSPTPHTKQSNCCTCDEQCLHHQTKYHQSNPITTTVPKAPQTPHIKSGYSAGTSEKARIVRED